MEFRKAHSAPKRVITRGEELSTIILDTMRTIADAVGGTLGPGGQPVLIERPDDLPPFLTKDGVTVFKALGFADSVQQAIMESTRDAAVRTANEAGDGTTTCTILAEALGRRTREFCARHPGASPHAVVRALERCLRLEVVPQLESLAMPVSLELDDAGKDTVERRRARDVARISANGDEELADVVMEAFDICGDEGNVTLLERIGNTKYEVEEIQGYPIAMGYEDSLGPFFTEFVREPAQHRTVMKEPLYVLYHGEFRDWATLEEALKTLFDRLRAVPGTWGQEKGERDIVLVACGFSDTVLGQLTANWKAAEDKDLACIMPLLVPGSAFSGGRKAFLDDLAAVVGAEVFDPITNPLSQITFEGLGAESAEEPLGNGTVGQVWRGRTESLEVGRRWTSVFGYADPSGDSVTMRVEELRAAVPGSASKLEVQELTERIARLSGGIARVTIVGTSNGDTRERKDRADDAVCAVKGALRRGALYGGCWALLQVAMTLASKAKTKVDPIQEILVPTLREPFRVLLGNVGVSEARIEKARGLIERSTREAPVVFDAVEGVMADAAEIGLYDSVPAVVEAIRSSLSIATLHGTMGAVIVFARDRDLELSEARAESRSKRLIRDVNKIDNGGTAVVRREE